MAINYKIVSIAEAGKTGGGLHKFYARICGRRTKTLRDVSKEISQESTLSPIDMVAALTALGDKIPQMLLDGNSVSLGDLGIFTLSISSSPSDEAEQVNTKNIKGVKIHFKPSKEIKKRLLEAKFEKMR
jgi:predicted histone-like DNA-binding protein